MPGHLYHWKELCLIIGVSGSNIAPSLVSVEVIVLCFSGSNSAPGIQANKGPKLGGYVPIH